MIKLDTPLTAVPGIGAKFGQKLAVAELTTVEDLLNYLPYRFEDFTNPTPITSVRIGEQVVVAGTLTQARNERTARRRMALTKALLTDTSGSMTAIWFNQPFMLRQLSLRGMWYLTGKVGYDSAAGKLLYVSTLEQHASIFPIYHEHEGLTSKWLRNFLGKVSPAVRLIPETLPDSFVTGHNLMGRAAAIAAIHNPQSASELERAKHRLSIEELLPIMVRNIRVRRELASEQAPAMAYDESLLKQFTGSLPFTLTNDQRLAAWRIIQDLGKPAPMNRLLQGEVGSGKTVVAAMAVLVTAKAGYQSLWLAPTEILANQHYRNVSKLLSSFGISVGLWTAGTKVGFDAPLVVGTHALLVEGLSFPKLGFVIVDEQHRFGVQQRAQLRAASGNTSARQAQLIPHFLSMTATPIPRTLFLTIWGDLDLTMIRELPAARKPVVTKLIAPAHRDEAYRFIRDEVAQDRQVFVVTPVIGEAENNEQKIRNTKQPKLFTELERKSALKEYEKLSKQIFPDLRIGLLHGRLSSNEKARVMDNFTKHKIDILVSTAVIEVGIDIANATVMMIEGAERFGLAQLHQLRGRVGRGEHQSYCLLLPESDDAIEHERLTAMIQANSGLELAEYDLKFRGPGELVGTRQHGVPNFQMASLTDRALTSAAAA